MDPATLARLALLSAILAVSANSAPPVITNNVPTPTVSANASQNTYVVKAGDTLYSIAIKFNTTIAALQQANQITNPNTLQVGQALVLPGAVTADTQAVRTPTAEARGPTVTPGANGSAGAAQADAYVIKAGDTLATIAAQFGVSVGELQQANQLTNPNQITVGLRLLIPQASNLQVVPNGVELDPPEVRQGDTVVIRVTTPGTTAVQGKFDQQELTFNKIGSDWVALAGISRCAYYIGNFPTELTVTDAAGTPKELKFNIHVNQVAYPIQDLTLTSQMAALLDPAIENAENARVASTVGQYTTDQLWTGKFRLPLDVVNPRISTTFGDRRSYNGGKPDVCGHEGTDYAVPGGTPVYAAANGTVVIAEPLKVRGNVVFIDYGHGVFSGYYHLSKIIAKDGQSVKPGDLVGEVGTTGFSTGNHLHWSMWVNGVYVNPDEWMERDIP